MLRILILLITISTAFAQKQEKPEAYKFFEVGTINNKLLKEKTEDFLQI